MEKRSKLILCLACVAVFALATATVNGVNLLTDPCAENGTSAPNPNPTSIPGWSFFNGAAFSTAFSLSGTQSLALVGNSTVPGAYQQFAANQTEVWTMTGFGMTPTALVGTPSFGLIQITFFAGPNGTGANLGTTDTGPGNAKASTVQINGSTPAGVWTQMTVTATAPTGAQSMQAFALVVDFSGNTQGVYFDDLTLVPEPSTIGMALTGLLGLVAFGWKKRRV